MATLFYNFGDFPAAFLNPGDVISAKPGFPEVCISAFSEKIIENMAKLRGVKTIAYLCSENGELPVYSIEYKGKEIAFYLSRVGAPACVVGLEEVIAMGAKKFVLFGSCGVLDEEAVRGKIVVPISAVRDEGTSYHYIPASEEIEADRNCINILKECLEILGYPYVEGKTWTMDALYRETSRLIEKRKQQGCLVVEMESSAAYAAARFRNVPMIQFLYGADSLDSETWEQRNLLAYSAEECGGYAKLALECAVRL